MGRIAEYVASLTPAERERFADLIEESTRREAQIGASAARAEAALKRWQDDQRGLSRQIRELAELSERLKETVGRVYLSVVPASKSVN